MSEKSEAYKRGLKELTPQKIDVKEFQYIVKDLLIEWWVDSMAHGWIEIRDRVR